MTDYNVGLITSSTEVLIRQKGVVPSCIGRDFWETFGNPHKEHLANPSRMIWDDGIILSDPRNPCWKEMMPQSRDL